MIPINVQFGSPPESIRIFLRKEWSVKDVKDRLIDKMRALRATLDFQNGNMAIIFAGRELQDDFIIGNCDLSNDSVVHLVKIKNRNEKNPQNNIVIKTTLAEAVVSLGICDDQQEYDNQEVSTNDTRLHNSSANPTDQPPSKIAKSFFTVYCSASSCKKITSGKLRVRCSQCKEDTLVVCRDPSSWNDVLIPNTIPGTCANELCKSRSNNQENKETFANFYFKCASSEHVRERHSDALREDDCTVPLHQIKVNLGKASCLACLDVAENVFLFECKHVMCLDCFKSFCLCRLNERQFKLDPEVGYSLSCPLSCPNSVIKTTHHFHVMDDDSYNKYQRFAAEEYTLSSGGVFCPRPMCGSGIVLDDENCNRISCRVCQFVFCKKCRQGFHVGDCDPGLPSVVVIEGGTSSGENRENEVSSRTTILSTTKPCPKCRTPVERNGGCMHMVCTRCGFEWCWVCQTEWSRECMANHWFD